MAYIKNIFNREFNNYVSITSFRYGATFATLVFVFFGYIDTIIVSDPTALQLTLWIRFGIIVPVMTIGVLLTYFRSFYMRIHKLVSFTMALTANCGLICMLYFATKFHETAYFNLYFSGLIIALSFGSLILWLNLVSSIILILSVVATYIMLIGVKASTFLPYADYITQLSFIITSGGLGVYVRSSFSVLNAGNFEKKLQLENDKVLLEQTNQDLLTTIDVKHRVISVLSHDVRGPIRNIQAALSLMMDNKISENEFQFLVKGINETLGATTILVDDVLSWADASNVVISESHEVRITELIDEVFCLNRQTAISKGVNLTIAANHDFIVKSKQDVIRFVLRNLVGNSIKFTENGEVKVAVSLDRENVLTIQVADTGKGVSENIVGKIFSTHKNISERGTKNEIGNGLGLFLCKQILNENNGDISFSSKKGEGTTFVFSLPVVIEEIPIEMYSDASSDSVFCDTLTIHEPMEGLLM